MTLLAPLTLNSLHVMQNLNEPAAGGMQIAKLLLEAGARVRLCAERRLCTWLRSLNSLTCDGRPSAFTLSPDGIGSYRCNQSKVHT